MMLTKRERELQKNQTMEQYRELVYKEAKRRLVNTCKVHSPVNVTHLREIVNQDNFEADVTQVVFDTIEYL